MRVAVIGGGIAGLSACWTYRKGRPNGTVLMLDQHPIFGGEAKQNEFDVDGYHLTAPQGATGIVVPFNKAKDAGMWSHFAVCSPVSGGGRRPDDIDTDRAAPEHGHPTLSERVT